MSSQHTAKSFLIFGSQIVSLGLRFVSNIVLAWLLVPSDFGVAAVVFTIITGVALFADVGIYDSLIRHKDGDSEDFLRTAQTLTLIRGIVLYLAVFIIAPFAESFFDIPSLTQYLRIASVNLILMGFCSVKIINLQRNMQVIPGIVIDFLAQLISVVLVIVLALQYRNVWPLILSSAITSLLVLIVSQVYKPSTFAIRTINYQFVREIFSFGKWILLSTIFTFLILNSDRLILARISDTTVTGIYNLGFMLGSIILGVTGMLTEKLIFPEISRLSRDMVVNDQLNSEIEKTLKGFMPIALTGTLMIFVISPLFFSYLYRDAYVDAGLVSQIMCIVCWCMLLYSMLNKTYIALNLPEKAAGFSFVTAAFRIVLCIVGYYHLDLVGFMVGLGVGSLLGFLIEYFSLKKRFGMRWVYCLRLSVYLGVYLVLYFVVQIFFHEFPYTQWVVMIITTFLVCVYLSRLYAERGLAYLKSRVKYN